jgi:serine/threonine kinase 32
MYVIGRGGFGKVWKVYSKKYKRAYALKEMAKAKIIDKKSERSIRYEKELLSKMNHP